MIRFATTLLVLLGALPLRATPPPLLPAPQRVSWIKGAFALGAAVPVRANAPEAATVADSIRQVLRAAPAGLGNASQAVDIRLEPDPAGVPPGPEAYRLVVTARRVELTSRTARGLFWGFRTLQQLHDPRRNTWAGCVIADAPAFAVRGYMHDVGRSFLTLETLKRHVSLLSRYKINTFHWHLTEDLAWRLQSRVQPNLTDSAVTQRFPGQFYTQQQAQELDDFCRKHHVLLIPEIDVPGHSGVFRRATGLDMQSRDGRAVVKALLTEACGLFSGPFLHLGTDEVAFRDSTFLPEMTAVVRACGKEVIGWAPGGRLDGSAVRQLWMGTDRPVPPGRVIDSRNLYLNHFTPLSDLVGLFQRRLCDTLIGSTTRLGAIACVWNDRRLADERTIEALNGFFPLMLTLAERAWRGGGQSETNAGVVVTDPPTFSEFEARLLAHKRTVFKNESFPYVRQSGQYWRILGPFHNGGDLDAAFPPERGDLSGPGQDAIGASLTLRHVWGPSVVKGSLTEPRPNHTAYAYTYVYSPRAQRVGAWIDFHNYGRSEKDASPPAGRWDYKGSRLWLNGEEIPPPMWRKPGVAMSGVATPGRIPADLEEPYLDEPAELRPPVPLTLRQGWNRLLVKLPVGAFKTPEYRLVKWMVTCVLVRPDGNHLETAEDLLLSPTKRFPLKNDFK